MITSRNNSLIKKIASLDNKKARDEEGLFILEGESFILEAINKGFRPEYIFSTYEPDNFVNCDYFNLVSLEVLLKLSQTKSPKGMVGVFNIFPNSLPNLEEINKILFLEDIQNSDNLGALIRSADASGFDLVVTTKKSADFFSPKTVRASAGSIFNVNLFRVEDFSFLATLKENAFYLLGSHLKGTEEMPNYNKKIALIIGNEGNGMSKEATLLCDSLIKIPIYGKAESLNASVAGGILMYKIVGY